YEGYIFDPGINDVIEEVGHPEGFPEEVLPPVIFTPLLNSNGERSGWSKFVAIGVLYYQDLPESLSSFSEHLPGFSIANPGDGNSNQADWFYNDQNLHVPVVDQEVHTTTTPREVTVDASILDGTAGETLTLRDGTAIHDTAVIRFSRNVTLASTTTDA